ncbi:proteasome subunit alpha [Sphaerisporangium siamense]|uniref:proteasome subunit alpha n=1 Tax=Sphaerisporangium siamense TaxID=795645 RepID=UPI001623057D|nr:proteasome subunit alpha [Sphaerisporangium siamense]
MPFGYVSPEQEMRDKADFARKGIARGRSVVVLQYEKGILFVAPNASRALHKISEIYDRIGFAAVGKYNEFEALRLGGIRYADINGYTYDRGDVTARGLANLYAQSLGMVFTESRKPYEVELVVAEVGDAPEDDQIYRLTFDGSVADEHGFVVMGGVADAVAARLKDRFRPGLSLTEALDAAVAALTEPGGERPPVSQLEVAVLDRTREHRKFQRLTGPRLERLLGSSAAEETPPQETPPQGPAPETPSVEGDSPATAPEGEIDTGSGD